MQSLPCLRSFDLVPRIKSDIFIDLASSAVRKAALDSMFLMLPPVSLNWIDRKLKSMSLPMALLAEMADLVTGPLFDSAKK